MRRKAARAIPLGGHAQAEFTGDRIDDGEGRQDGRSSHKSRRMITGQRPASHLPAPIDVVVSGDCYPLIAAIISRLGQGRSEWSIALA
jgi:hypothetical protein